MSLSFVLDPGPCSVFVDARCTLGGLIGKRAHDPVILVVSRIPFNPLWFA